jgi:SAM-dependent methyltransferase
MEEHHNDEVAEHTGHDTGQEDRFDRLRDPKQYRYLSAEELQTYLAPSPEWTVVDLGSGAGFYTDKIAMVVDGVYAVDSSEEILKRYQREGTPAGVKTVIADVSSIPIENNVCDAAVSIRTFHHGVAEALPEVRRLLREGGRFVVMDWSASGEGNRNRGPDPDRCFDLATVQSMLLEAGFSIRNAHERRETFIVVAQRT